MLSETVPEMGLSSPSQLDRGQERSIRRGTIPMRDAGCRGRTQPSGRPAASEPGRGGARGDGEGPHVKMSRNQACWTLAGDLCGQMRSLAVFTGWLRGDRMVGVPHGTVQA